MALALSLDCYYGGLMKKVIVIGGGVAGLSALNRLVDLGISVTLIEAGNYPSHKICGEFFSPECLPILSAWNVEPPKQIKSISLVTQNHSLSFPLPTAARSQSHFEFDENLVKRAQIKGAQILTNTKVKEIRKNEIILDNEKALPYSDLIISAGRFFNTSPPHYIGLKTYFKDLNMENDLEMYPLHGGYAGLSPVGKGYFNFTCLLPLHIDHQDKLFKAAPHLQHRLQHGQMAWKEWMTCRIPAFGMKKTPIQPNTYFIGDAAGTIPPASGLGLSIAITSGYMCANYVAKNDSLGFRDAWYHKYKNIFAYGHFLHWLLTKPLAIQSAIRLGKLFPKLPSGLFSKNRII